MTSTIRFNQASLRKLKGQYLIALDKKAEQFEFEGRTMLTAYARYLIEYLESQLE